MKRSVLALLLAAMLILTGCAAQKTPEQNAGGESVSLKIAGAWEDFKAIEVVADGFCKQNPNCTVEYEYLQDYYASLEKRLAGGEDKIDLFVTTKILKGAALEPYTLDLYAAEGTDLTHTFEGLIRNFEDRSDADGKVSLYTVPFGAEIRGLFVNTTLLDSLGIAVPTNRAELIQACQTLLDNGYIPMHGNPGQFSQQLLYPYVCNLIANAKDHDAVYARVNAREAGTSELFRAPMAFMYEMVEKGYYNYKYVENEKQMFTDTTDEAYARYFLNIAADGDKFVKKDDVGQVAFMPSPMSLESLIAKTKSDYHSEIAYTFILAPVSDDGGFAYMSPTHGISVNKASDHADWAVRFLNYLFTPETNQLFADTHHVVPNTADAFKRITEQFRVKEDHISHLGEVTFDYEFYNVMLDSLLEVSKGNNPKYMQDDGNGGTVMYPLDYYMDHLEKRLTGTTEE